MILIIKKQVVTTTFVKRVGKRKIETNAINIHPGFHCTKFRKEWVLLYL